MNSYEREVWLKHLNDETDVLDTLKHSYESALSEVNERLRQLYAEGMMANDADLQAKIYQIQYQQALKNTIEARLGSLAGENFVQIGDYLQYSYEDGYLGTIYSALGQGMKLDILPFDERQMVRVINLTNDGIPLSARLYTNIEELTGAIRAQFSRGIASSMTWKQIAQNLTAESEAALYQSQRIARTEGHRVMNEGTYDSMREAKNSGADIVKQWDSTLDSRTRPSHIKLDGQIVEVDETFKTDGMQAEYPGGFGVAAMDINCRCVILQRARWALKREERTKYSRFDEGIIKYQTYEEFLRASRA